MKPAVIKIGGALLAHQNLMDSFWDSIQQLYIDRPVVIIHGGGPQATQMATKLGHKPNIIEGRRQTTDLDLAIVHWTLCGELNTHLVAQALAKNLPAVGLKGIDGQILTVIKRPPWNISGQLVDFGWVGDVQNVSTDLLMILLEHRYLPIISPLGIDESGKTYNVNADTVAQNIASTLKASLFCLVTASGGVRRDAKDPRSLIREMDMPTYCTGKKEGWIRNGMIVKLKVAFEARHTGIPDVHILSPEDVFTRTRGTQII